MASTVENDEEPGPGSGGGHTSSTDNWETRINEPEELPDTGSLDDISQQIHQDFAPLTAPHEGKIDCLIKAIQAMFCTALTAPLQPGLQSHQEVHQTSQ